MNKKEMLKDLYGAVNEKYNFFKEKVIEEEQEDYCDEMSLMYSFRKFIQYVGHEEIFTEEELTKIQKFGSIKFIEEFMETFWGSQLGNSYKDIEILIKETLKEI